MARDGMDDRLDEEVRFHIDMQTERNIRMGMTPDEARRQANLQFGGREKWKSEARDEYRGRWFDGLRGDFVFAARSLAKHRGFALTATLTLAGATFCTVTLVLPAGLAALSLSVTMTPMGKEPLGWPVGLSRY